MANHYRGSRLTNVEEAIIQQDIDRLNAGVFTSQTEIAAAIGNKAYHVQGPLGDLYRAALDNRAGRTQAGNVSIIGNNKVSDIYPAAAKQAGATRDADGNIVVGILEVDNPHGEIRAEAEDDENSNKPQIEHKPGGVVSVSINRGSLPLIDGSVAEKKAREEYLARANARKQGIPTIPLIPQKPNDASGK